MSNSFSRPPLETSAADTLDRARLARIRARLDGEFAEFDAGIDKLLAEVERLRTLRSTIGYLAERIDRPVEPPPLTMPT